MTEPSWSTIRKSVLKRDGYLCQDCDSPIGTGANPHLKNAEVHHLTPRQEGGADKPENLVALCSECHNERHGGMENEVETFVLDFLNKHQWSTPNLMRKFYHENHEHVSRSYFSQQLRKLADRGVFEKVHKNADEYRIVDDPRDGDA